MVYTKDSMVKSVDWITIAIYLVLILVLQLAEPHIYLYRPNMQKTSRQQQTMIQLMKLL